MNERNIAHNVWLYYQALKANHQSDRQGGEPSDTEHKQSTDREQAELIQPKEPRAYERNMHEKTEHVND